MAGLDFKDIQILIRLVTKSELSEFKMKDGEFELSIRTTHYTKGKERETVVQAMPVSAAPATQMPVNQAALAQTPDLAPDAAKGEEDNTQADSDANIVPIKSPIVGTFYRSASPDKPAYVKVGDTVDSGSVVCIVEAMKLFNEIESEISGKIVKVMVDDASPVEYDQVLFLVDTKG